MNDTELDPEIAALLSNAQSSVQVEEYKAPGDAVKLSKGFSRDEVNIYGTESAPKPHLFMKLI